MGGGLCLPKKRGYYFFIIHFIYYFLFYANPLPSFIPRSLNLHNRQVDDRIAGKEEVLLKGVVVDVEAEEMEEEAMDLLVGIVGKKIMRNRSHAEALPIFYSVRKWREI